MNAAGLHGAPGPSEPLESHPSLQAPPPLIVASGVSFGSDRFEHPIALLPNDWTMRSFTEKIPDLKLHDLPLEQRR